MSQNKNRKKSPATNSNSSPSHSTGAAPAFLPPSSGTLHLPGHALRSRRDFLAHGLIGSAAFIMAPTLLGTLLRSEEARAADVCGNAGVGQLMPAVLIIDHAGGAGLLGQTLPFAMGDQLLDKAGYNRIGMSTAKAPVSGSFADASWGIPFHNELSFVRTLNQTALPEAKAKTNSFFSIQSLGDDTGNNPTNPASGLALLGAVGDGDRKIASVIGTQDTLSGGNSISAINSSLFRSTRIQNSQGASNLVTAGRIANANIGLNRKIASRVMTAVQRMSRGQLDRFSQQDLPQQVKQLVDCGYINGAALAGEVAQGVPSVNPAEPNSIVSQAFNMQNATEERAAALVHLLAMGFSGVATLTLGGRDYHNNTRQTGEQQDAEAARITAKAINAFHRVSQLSGARKRSLMIIHITDGGVAANQTEDGNVPGFFQWVSDRGTANAAYVFVYHPDERPLVAKNQLGYASITSGDVELKGGAATPFSTNGVALAEVFMANYLQFAGKSAGDISKVALRTNLNAEHLKQFAVVAKK